MGQNTGHSNGKLAALAATNSVCGIRVILHACTGTQCYTVYDQTVPLVTYVLIISY